VAPPNLGKDAKGGTISLSRRRLKNQFLFTQFGIQSSLKFVHLLELWLQSIAHASSKCIEAFTPWNYAQQICAVKTALRFVTVFG
jgi:hypothetical protein